MKDLTYILQCRLFCDPATLTGYYYGDNGELVYAWTAGEVMS